jgi:predicted SnoaL-like aldol condensation-catalyzing enzyme
MLARLALTTLIAFTLFAAAPAEAGISKHPKAKAAMGLLDMVFNQKKVKEGFDKYVGDKYIQHNPIAPDGKEPAVEILGKALQALPGWSYEFKHAYVDGDIVVLHSHVRISPRTAAGGGRHLPLRERQDRRALGRRSPIPEKSANNNTMF